jgi:hypothetical protein
MNQSSVFVTVCIRRPTSASMTVQRLSIASRLFLLAACIIAFVGCGSGHPTAQISGKVVFPDGKIPEVNVRMIRFECAKDTDAAVRKGASGKINHDGTFELYTRKPGDGVHYGKYDVTFAIFQSATDQRPLVPIEYTKSATTPLHVVVDDDKDDHVFTIEARAPQ